MLSCYAAGVVVTRLLLGWLPDRFGPLRALAMACGVAAAGLIAIAVAGNLAVAAGGGVLTGAGMSLIYPALGLFVLRDIEGTRHRQTAIAAFGSFVDIGVGLGGPLLGLVATQGGYSAAFTAAAVLMILAFVVQAVRHVTGRRL